MPTLACPNCTTMTPRLLEAPSEYADVSYYRCVQCGHVWTVNKSDPTRITHITPFPRTPDA